MDSQICACGEHFCSDCFYRNWSFLTERQIDLCKDCQNERAYRKNGECHFKPYITDPTK